MWTHIACIYIQVLAIHNFIHNAQKQKKQQNKTLNLTLTQGTMGKQLSNDIIFNESSGPVLLASSGDLGATSVMHVKLVKNGQLKSLF